MEKYIILFGLTLFIYNLGLKLGFWLFMEQLSGRVTVRVLHQLLQCHWCMMFYVSWIITIFYGLIVGFDFSLLPLPFINAGLLTLKMTKQ